MDLFPTLTNAAGITLPDTFKSDEYDFWNSIVEDRETNRPDFVLGNSDIAVYRLPWKLIISAFRGEPQLFDIVEDPYEKNDLIGENPEIVQALTKVGQKMFRMAEVTQQENGAPTQGRSRGGRAGQGRVR